MPFRKKKNKEETLLKESEKKSAPPRASLRQLLRYASVTDMFLLFIGCMVAIIVGIGKPIMAIVMGDISQSFIDIESVLHSASNSTQIVDVESSRDIFNKDVVKNCLMYVYLGIATFVAASIQTMCFLMFCENIVNRLRRNFFQSIMRQDIEYFDKNGSGTLATKLFDNLERVKEGTGDKFGLMIQFVAQFFGGFIVAFMYNWKLTLIMMSLVPFIIVCGAYIARLIATASSQESKQYAVAGAIAEEVLTSIRTVIAFNGQQYECNRYDEALKEGSITGIKKSLFSGIGLGVTFMIMFSSYALAFWVGTDMVNSGEIDGGTVMTVIFAVMMGAMALGSASPQVTALGNALGAAGALYEIIDRTPEIDAYSKDGIKPEKMKGRIVFKNIHFSYPTRTDVSVLKGINFEANPGETIALVGSSGCGKSTIIQLLLRYYNPAVGSITIDGHEIRDINIDFLRKYIGVVSQEPVLFNTTIEQNIRYARDNISDAELAETLRRANAFDFVQSFPKGVDTMVGDSGTQLSGGQKQRIAIARALVRDPKILLLDEATSALDAESEHVVQQALENASKGRTTIVIAHRLSTIRNADKIIAIKDGEVAEIGTHDELMARKDLYFNLVNSQVFADVESTEEHQPLQRHVSFQSPRRSISSDVTELKRQMSKTPREGNNSKDGAKKELDRLKQECEEEGVVKSNLYRILKYAQSEFIFIAIGILASLFQGIVFPAFAIIFTEIIYIFSKTGDELVSVGRFYSLMFIVLGAIELVTMIAQCFFFGISAERLTMRLRSKVFRNVMRQDAIYFDMPRHSAGKISTRLATDAPNVKSAIDYRFGSVFNSLVSLILGITISLYYGWIMAVASLCIFPLAAVGQSLRMKFLAGREATDARDMEHSGETAMEAIENIRTVQALTLQMKLHNLFCIYLDKPHKTNKQKAVMQGLIYGFAISIFYFVYAACFLIGLYLIVLKISEPMDVLKVLFAISFTAGGLGFASAYFPEYIKATFAAGLIFKMLEEEPRIDGMTQGGKKPKLTGDIQLNKVYFKYPERPDVPILQGLDVEIRSGQTLAIVGSSGCGKSTVISLLERLYDPMDGSITIDGNDLREMNPTHLRSHIALVSQEPTLFNTSIRDNIIYGISSTAISEENILEAAKKANIHEFVSKLPDGYNTQVGEKGTQLSGGQKQRIAIARALIRNPMILLLDEATSALDTESEKLVQEAMDKASEGRTCIVIAHRLSTVINANCIMVVNKGQVVEKGTHNELLKKRGAYWNLTQKQNSR